MTVRDIFLSANNSINDTNTYWLRRVTNNGPYDKGMGACADAADNVYIVGCGASQTTTDDGYIAKVNSLGSLQWAVKIGLGGGDDERINAVASDTIGSFVYAVVNSQPTSGNFQLNLVKLSQSAGAISWQRSLGIASNMNQMYGVDVDSAGNIYVCGVVEITQGRQDIVVAKYSTAGSVLWKHNFNAGTGHVGATGLKVSPAGNVYVVGYGFTSGDIPTGRDYESDYVWSSLTNDGTVIVLKINTSGALQWQTGLQGVSTLLTVGTSLGLDTSDNVYVCGLAVESGSASVSSILVKYDSAGTLQWQRKLSAFTSSTPMLDARATGVTVSSTGDVFVTGSTTTTLGYTAIFIAKYSSVGTLFWINYLRAAATSLESRGIALDSSGGLTVSGYIVVGGSYSIFCGKFPYSGAKLGTYTLGAVAYVYASATTMTDAAGTLTEVTPGLTQYTNNLTSATSTLITSTANFTYSTVTL